MNRLSADRVTDEVRFGTYGGSDFDRDGMSVPARSDTALRTSYSYGTDGTVQDVTDPRALVQRTQRDDAGRVTSEIRNYEDGTPSGSDSDATVKYTYTDGLRTKITADLPSGYTDQDTTYTYGTTKGASAGDSKIGTGHLLQEVKYPDSAGASDVVSMAYNAQGQEIYKQDQAGNVFEREYDGSGRLAHTRVTTLDADFDGAVRRISTAYDSLGRRSTVTQWDNATVGSGDEVDEVKFTYDDWGKLEKFEQDRNGTVGESGSVDDYEISYAWEKQTTGRNALRRNTLTLPSGAVIDYNYRDVASRHDDEMSRVTYLEHGTTIVASYQYNGLGQVVEQDYNEIDVMWQTFTGSPPSYDDLDRFDRVTTSKWTKDLATDVNLYDIDITYDRNSNITLIEDNVHSGFDVEYTMDEVDRLTRAEEGTWNGSSITSRTRDQDWTLDQVGNWERDKLDLDGDLAYTGADEWDDCRTHNDVNELTGRDLDCTPGTTGDNYTLSYDEAGNLTDDATDYEYEWDAFYRLRKVRDQSSDLVAEYRYNGLGYRIAEHVDTDDDGDVDGNDDWRYFAYDERWRITAAFLNSDTDPVEEFLHHAAGLNGTGGSSYIDLVVLRERDTDDNGTLDERLYYCQNWRADVSAIVDDSGQMMEWAKYSAYGVPFGLPGADTDSDGDCDSTDVSQIQTWIDTSAYDVRGDVDLDGDVDANDKSTVQNSYEDATLGWGTLSGSESYLGRSGAVVARFGASDLALGRLRLQAVRLGVTLQRWRAGSEEVQTKLAGDRDRVSLSVSSPGKEQDPPFRRPGPGVKCPDCEVSHKPIEGTRYRKRVGGKYMSATDKPKGCTVKIDRELNELPGKCVPKETDLGSHGVIQLHECVKAKPCLGLVIARIETNCPVALGFGGTVEAGEGVGVQPGGYLFPGGMGTIGPASSGGGSFRVIQGLQVECGAPLGIAIVGAMVVDVTGTVFVVYEESYLTCSKCPEAQLQ